MDTKQELLDKIESIHSTPLGEVRIMRNLCIDHDPIAYCKEILLNQNSSVYRNGKNYYIENNNIIITINAYSHTIITAHKKRSD